MCAVRVCDRPVTLLQAWGYSVSCMYGRDGGLLPVRSGIAYAPLSWGVVVLVIGRKELPVCGMKHESLWTGSRPFQWSIFKKVTCLLVTRARVMVARCQRSIALQTSVPQITEDRPASFQCELWWGARALLQEPPFDCVESIAIATDGVGVLVGKEEESWRFF